MTMTYELWIERKMRVSGYSEEAMRAYIRHLGFDRFTVYNSAGYDKTEAFQ
jgi:choline kinase